MATLPLVAVLVVCSTSVARADREMPWRDIAAKQLADRIGSEWMSIVDARTFLGWSVALPRGRKLAGGWAIRAGDGWTYLFDDATVRCRIQPGTPAYVLCDDLAPVADTVARVVIAPTTRPRSLATLRKHHRGVFGDAVIRPDASGRATVETIVSTPMAESRTSRRYRAVATLTTTGVMLDEPVLVEQYRETCHGVHGCMAVHWNCQRVR